MLGWWEAAACGAGGGLIAEAVVTYGRLKTWQQARHAARATAAPLPRLVVFVDPLADSIAALLRVLLGGAAGWLLHVQITGVYAVGASAPALLAQVGRAATPTEALRGPDSGEADTPPPNDTEAARPRSGEAE
ncbi:hypothetical protein BOQ63_005830 (plasmid) [Streptomyces viridifaciens]|nr:hypothetical protein CP971_33030 [Streptomyces viridifaciens]UKZ03612.1 hypothetical protein BOQ63_005830 [Streptomyces viridifaciens]